MVVTEREDRRKSYLQKRFPRNMFGVCLKSNPCTYTHTLGGMLVSNVLSHWPWERHKVRDLYENVDFTERRQSRSVLRGFVYVFVCEGVLFEDLPTWV